MVVFAHLQGWEMESFGDVVCDSMMSSLSRQSPFFLPLCLVESAIALLGTVPDLLVAFGGLNRLGGALTPVPDD